MNELKPATGSEAGLSGDDQIRVALQRMIERGGEAQMPDIYEAVEARVGAKGFTLSKQGRASLRFFVNRVAVQAGYVYPHDKAHPGWRVTPEGREFARAQDEWLKFLAGCFARRVESAVFVTTGRLTGAQRREAQEAKVIVLEGATEIFRLAGLHYVEPFDLSVRNTDDEAG